MPASAMIPRLEEELSSPSPWTPYSSGIEKRNSNMIPSVLENQLRREAVRSWAKRAHFVLARQRT